MADVRFAKSRSGLPMCNESAKATQDVGQTTLLLEWTKHFLSVLVSRGMKLEMYEHDGFWQPGRAFEE